MEREDEIVDLLESIKRRMPDDKSEDIVSLLQDILSELKKQTLSLDDIERNTTS